jgi:hypothetical protein
MADVSKLVRLFGDDPGHRDYRRRCQEQLLALIQGDDHE